ncbi:hypothetical protein QJS10_CPA07g01361 [Acorus calamus]|uniref:AB hydrolase-1 domain-containing protein n=1 Tax=Acorus calamus TaxID=4465 RepID=A0AAV9EG57_ACOCL|nr:hypothetical protein QJS10_CPA07g01361 [Acorus calamus]
MVAKLTGAPRLTLLDHRSSSSGDQSVLRWSLGFLRRVVDLGRARVEYAEQVLEKKQKKKKSVAGVEQEELVDETSLGDPDSLFLELNGVQIHHKLCCSELQYYRQVVVVKFPFLLLHGFGASAFSWNLAMDPLSRLTSSKVLAFDRPAFGLTSREAPVHAAGTLNPYSTSFSVRATVSFVDSLGDEKAIIVGHSAGSIVAVNTYFEAPERVAALILVCPALAAPLISLTPNQNNNNNNNNQKITIESETTRVPLTGDHDDDDAAAAAFVGFGKFLSNLCTYVAWVMVVILIRITCMVSRTSSSCRKSLSALLSSSFAVTLTRTIIDVFGLPIVRFAWHDSTRFTDHFVQGYTKPLKTKGWEMALLEFANAMVTDSESKPPLMKRLSKISCPVLIITGDNDRIIPTWNAKSLSSVIPGSILEVIQNCGHLPHEEKVEEFSSVVDKFLHRVFGNLDLKQEIKSNQC